MNDYYCWQYMTTNQRRRKRRKVLTKGYHFCQRLKNAKITAQFYWQLRQQKALQHHHQINYHCKGVILRDIIGGFGFCGFYYTLSTLPLGEATMLLSLYPIVPIFLTLFVLGEEMKPEHIAAVLLSMTVAALISCPTFLSWCCTCTSIVREPRRRSVRRSVWILARAKCAARCRMTVQRVQNTGKLGMKCTKRANY